MAFSSGLSVPTMSTHHPATSRRERERERWTDRERERTSEAKLPRARRSPLPSRGCESEDFIQGGVREG